MEDAMYPSPFLCHEQLVVTSVCYWSCRNTLEARSPMPTDMAQGEGLEPVNGPCGEAAGESWLSLLSHPARNLIRQVAFPSSQSFVLLSLYWPCGVENQREIWCLDICWA